MAEECDTTKRVIIKHASFPGKRHVRSKKIYFYSFKAYRMETRQEHLAPTSRIPAGYRQQLLNRLLRQRSDP